MNKVLRILHICMYTLYSDSQAHSALNTQIVYNIINIKIGVTNF